MKKIFISFHLNFVFSFTFYYNVYTIWCMHMVHWNKEKKKLLEEYLQTQHTPKPKAHCPLEVPPCIRHSYTLRQTPDLLPSSDKHSSSTGTGKKLRTVKKNKIVWIYCGAQLLFYHQIKQRYCHLKKWFSCISKELI